MLILQAVPAFDVFSLFVSISTFTVERSWLRVLYTNFTIISTWLQQQQQQRPFNGLWSGTTRVGRYQKKHSPTHTHLDHRASFKALDYTWFYFITTVLFIPAVFFWGREQKYGTELLKTNYCISFHRGPDTWMVPLCWQSDGRGNET